MNNLALHIGKALTPLRKVEYQWIQRLDSDLDPRVKIPSRKSFPSSILPNLAAAK